MTETVRNFVGLSDGSGEWKDPRTGKPGEGALYSDVVFPAAIWGEWGGGAYLNSERRLYVVDAMTGSNSETSQS